MIRKIVLLAAAAVMLPGVVLADNGPGCGWGASVFKGQSGLMAHISAATTNGTSYNQLFGLTSGTAGCNPNSVVSNEYQRKAFVASNMDNITQEIAQGQGNHLVSLASLMGVSEQDRTQFLTLAKANSSELIASSEFGGDVMLAKLDGMMAGDPALSKYVRQ